MSRPLLLLVAGPALAGKSTLIHSLQKMNPQLAIVSSDDIRMELYGHYNYDPQNEPKTWQVIHQRIQDYLNNGHPVVLDSTLRTRIKRDEFRNLYQPKVEVCCIAFSNVTLSTLLERNQLRSWKQFSPEVVTRLFHEYELPTLDETMLFDRFTWIPFNYSADDLHSIDHFIINP